MNCHICGRRTPDDAGWCPYCGTRLDAGDATVLGTPPSPDADATRLTPPPVDPNATRIGPGPGTPPPATLRGRTRSGGTIVSRTMGGARAFGDNANDLVGQALGTRYQIIKILGAGGMDAVYQT